MCKTDIMCKYIHYSHSTTSNFIKGIIYFTSISIVLELTMYVYSEYSIELFITFYGIKYNIDICSVLIIKEYIPLVLCNILFHQCFFLYNLIIIAIYIFIYHL